MSSTWYQQNEGLDVSIGKNGIWIVRSDNKVYYRDHSQTTQQDENNVGWQSVESMFRFFAFASIDIKFIFFVLCRKELNKSNINAHILLMVSNIKR